MLYKEQAKVYVLEDFSLGLVDSLAREDIHTIVGRGGATEFVVLFSCSLAVDDECRRKYREITRRIPDVQYNPHTHVRNLLRDLWLSRGQRREERMQE